MGVWGQAWGVWGVWETCKRCKGSGSRRHDTGPQGERNMCAACRGTGRVWAQDSSMPCKRCKGSGSRRHDTGPNGEHLWCAACNGTGYFRGQAPW